MEMKTPEMSDLFSQLGLEESEEAIARFIKSHQLPSDVRLSDAPFWSAGQRQFLLEQFTADAAWVVVVDELNQALHQEAMEKEAGDL